MVARKLATEGYLVIEPIWRRNAPDRVERIKLSKVTGRKPRLSSNQYAIRVKLEMTESMFARLIPEVTIKVTPEHLVEPDLVVLDPGDGE